jgi:hypothetical protein
MLAAFILNTIRIVICSVKIRTNLESVARL